MVRQQSLVFRVEGSPIPMTGPIGKPRPADQKARSVDSPHRLTKKGREQGEPEGREVMEEGLRLECRRWSRKEWGRGEESVLGQRVIMREHQARRQGGP